MGGYSKDGVVNGREGHSSKGVVNWWKMAIKVDVANNTRLEPTWYKGRGIRQV